MRKTMFALFAIGIASRAVDRFYLRPVGNIFSVESVRAAREAGSNAFSAIGAITPAFAIVIYCVVRERLSSRQRLAALVCIAVVLLDVYFNGSRGAILVIGALLVGHRLTMRRILALIVLAIPLSGLLYLARFTSLTGGTAALSQVMYTNSTLGYAIYVPISSDHAGILTSSLGRILGFPVVQLNQYLAHSLFEFSSFYSNIPGSSWAPGSLVPQFPGLPTQSDFYYPPNVYYTMIGTLAISFGKMATFAAAVVGGFLGFVYRRSIALGSSARALVLVALAGAPVVNTLGGYDLVFYLVAIAVVSRYQLVDVPDDDVVRQPVPQAAG